MFLQEKLWSEVFSLDAPFIRSLSYCCLQSQFLSLHFILYAGAPRLFLSISLRTPAQSGNQVAGIVVISRNPRQLLTIVRTSLISVIQCLPVLGFVFADYGGYGDII